MKPPLLMLNLACAAAIFVSCAVPRVAVAGPVPKGRPTPIRVFGPADANASLEGARKLVGKRVRIRAAQVMDIQYDVGTERSVYQVLKFGAGLSLVTKPNQGRQFAIKVKSRIDVDATCAHVANGPEGLMFVFKDIKLLGSPKPPAASP